MSFPKNYEIVDITNIVNASYQEENGEETNISKTKLSVPRDERVNDSNNMEKAVAVAMDNSIKGNGHDMATTDKQPIDRRKENKITADSSAVKLSELSAEMKDLAEAISIEEYNCTYANRLIGNIFGTDSNFSSPENQNFGEGHKLGARDLPECYINNTVGYKTRQYLATAPSIILEVMEEIKQNIRNITESEMVVNKKNAKHIRKQAIELWKAEGNAKDNTEDVGSSKMNYASKNSNLRMPLSTILILPEDGVDLTNSPSDSFSESPDSASTESSTDEIQQEQLELIDCIGKNLLTIEHVPGVPKLTKKFQEIKNMEKGLTLLKVSEFCSTW